VNKKTKNNIKRRYDTLNERASTLIGKRLTEVAYHDGVDDLGIAFYTIDPFSPHRHELMQGVDLIVHDNSIVGFYWEWWRNDYELGINTSGVHSVLKSNLPVFDPSQDVHWNGRIGKTITDVTITLHQYNFLCDCRISFDDANPVWICARNAEECTLNGDDIILVFTEQEAKRIGIDVNA